MASSEIIETIVAEVTQPVSIVIEPVEGAALARRKSGCAVDRLIKQAQKEVEPNLTESIRRRFGVDLEPPLHSTVDAARSFVSSFVSDRFGSPRTPT